MKENRKIRSLNLIKETLEDEIVRLKERLKEYEIIEDDIADLSLYKEDVNRLQNENNLLVEELSKHVPRSVVDNIINPPKNNPNNVLRTEEVDRLLRVIEVEDK